MQKRDYGPFPIGNFEPPALPYEEARVPPPLCEPVLTGPVQPQSHPSGFAFILFVLGLSVWFNNAWLLVTLVPAVGVIAMIVIPREERFLDRNFPDQYSSYKAAVRRWF